MFETRRWPTRPPLGRAVCSPGCAAHGLGEKAPACQRLFPAPGASVSLGVGKVLGCTGHHLLEPPCLGPAPAQPPGPLPSFWQLPGLGEPGLGWVTSQLCLQPLGGLCFRPAQGPIPLPGREPTVLQHQRLVLPGLCQHLAKASNQEACESCVHGCLPVPPGAWTRSRGEALPAFPCLSDRSETPWKGSVLTRVRGGNCTGGRENRDTC